jgi:hypothetical protein
MPQGGINKLQRQNALQSIDFFDVLVGRVGLEPTTKGL